METKIKYYEGRESDCGNYEPETKPLNKYGNPHYESKDPYKVKLPISWQVNYLIDWIIILVIAVGVVLFIVNAI